MCAHIVAGDREKPTSPSTVAGTSTRRPRAFGLAETFPAVDVSTTGCSAAGASAAARVVLACAPLCPPTATPATVVPRGTRSPSQAAATT